MSKLKKKAENITSYKRTMEEILNKINKEKYTNNDLSTKDHTPSNLG